MSKELNSYELSRNWFDFAFENPELISPNHVAIYFFAIEHCNRLGWRSKFGFPTQMAMDAIGIKKHQTYIRYFNDLVEWGFFKLVQKSQNQYSSNIISLVSDLPKNGKALDKAIINHRAKQTETIGQSNSSIDKQVNNLTNKPLSDFDLAFKDFEKMRKLIKKPLTDRARNMILNKLDKLATDKPTQIKILENSIVNNWQDIYPLKENNKVDAEGKDYIIVKTGGIDYN